MFMREKLLKKSDEYRVHVCDKCGLLAKADTKKGSYECKACGPLSDVYQTTIPYAAKLLFQELMAMMIAPRIRVTSS